MRIKMRITGLKPLVDSMDSTKVSAAMRDAEKRAAKALAAKIRPRVPVDTGALRDSGYVVHGSVIRGIVDWDTLIYARIQDAQHKRKRGYFTKTVENEGLDILEREVESALKRTFGIG